MEGHVDQGRNYVKNFLAEHPISNTNAFDLVQTLAWSGVGTRVFGEPRGSIAEVERKMALHYTAARLDIIRNDDLFDIDGIFLPTE